MKIYCECGHIISDQTDYISYKARFVADQDYFDLQEAVEMHIKELVAAITGSPPEQRSTAAAAEEMVENVYDTIRSYMRRAIYQCSACGRLFVDDAQFNSQVFVPNDSVPHNLMRSMHGDQWKRPLRGLWKEWQTDPDKGELWWGFGDAEQGYEHFDNFETLQEKYFEVFTRLHAKGILRDAHLRKGEEMIHQWP
ncbi:MAG: hypothetical protein MUD01_24370 [Chloroflexaceae bacterium]|jgi:hypothetical protein|nr:hypothetical protein [Chloroflexaceae bacterium]